MKIEIILKAGEGSNMPTFSLASGTYVLGRSSRCDLVVKHDTVSRSHAEIVVKSMTVSVRDLRSKNGTFIDDIRIDSGIIRPKQTVKFGTIPYSATALNEYERSNSEVETAHCDNSIGSTKTLLPKLSTAQNRVCVLLLRGLSEKEVAEQLSISQATVHNHVQAIYKIYCVHSRPELLVRMLAGAKVGK
jgi:DNA-binding NarL/FixJ family response regulator